MKLSIVIPIYNEEAILEREVEGIISDMKNILPDVQYELLLVENGSHDRTHTIAEELAQRHAEIRAIHLPSAGYGSALKCGLLEATGELVALFNIDFWDVPFIRNAFGLLKERNLDMVVGSKTMQGAEDTRPFVRRLITRTFNTLLRLIFGFSGTDTHGIKLLRRDKMVPIIQACKTEREIFDTEFVLRAQMAEFKSDEIPVVCQEKRKTTYHIAKRIPRTVKDLGVLFFTLRFSKVNKLHATLAVASILYFIFVALWGFPDSPSPWFDEGINLGIAKTFAQDGVFSLRLGPGEYIRERSLIISTNYPLLGFISFAFKLFGVGLAEAKIVMFAFLAVFLALTYALVRQLSHSRFIALSSLLLVITFLPFYGNGLSGGIGEVAGLVYLFSGLLLLEKKKPWQVFLTGLLFGLAGATKVIYVSVVFCLIFAECWAAWRERSFPWKRWSLLSMGGVVPLIVWIYTLIPQASTLMDFLRTFAYYSNPYQATSHTFTTNLLKFFTETTPFHFLLLFCAVAAAFLIQRQWEDHRRLKIVLAVFVTINAIWFLATPGWYRYLFPAHLVVLVLFPIALHDLASRFTSQWVKKYSTVFVVSALVLVQSVHLIRERDSKLYYNPAPRVAAMQIDNEFGEPSDLLIIDQPELWFLLKNPNVRQYFRANPYAAFGEDIFSENGKLPQYIVTSVPERSGYLTEHREQLDIHYSPFKQYGHYTVFQRK